MFYLKAIHTTLNDEADSGSYGYWTAYIETNIDKCHTGRLE